MLFRLLDTLRTKPKMVRRQYAFALAFVVTVTVGAVWSMSLPARFKGETQLAAGTTPFAGFVDRIKGSWQLLVPTREAVVNSDQATEISTTVDALSLLGSTTPTTTSRVEEPPAVPVLIGTSSVPSSAPQ
ncbi:MAG: hypothetical protein RLZZ70_730 [Candidatus Parcubacteria bacterium]|jgi:hypothetical protein